MGLSEAIYTRLSDKMPTTPYHYGTSRPFPGPGDGMPNITAEEPDLAGETSYQTGGTDIQRIMLRFRVWALVKSEGVETSKQLVNAFIDVSPTWRPVWTGGQLIDAYQSGVTTTNESDQVDSQNRVIWVSESVIEFLITRE